MYIEHLFSGEWIYFTGGSSIRSRRLRFVNDVADYRFEISYKFDVDDEILLQFLLSSDEIHYLMHTLQKNKYVKLETEKNGYSFLLEMQIFPDGLELKLDGHGMSWPGHPQRFLMTEFERIEFLGEEG